MNLITVNQEKCIKCGLCVKECPERVLELSKNGPKEVCSEECISCGHCVAICPREAIDNIKTPLSTQISSKKFPKLSPEDAENFLRSRRSIRSYKETPVPREKLTKLVNIAHFAPSGHNLQGISYVIIDDRKLIDKAVKIIIEEFEKANVSNNFTKPYREKGTDTILRGASSLILATADSSFPRGRENSILSFTYLELYAPTLGLGSCWAGMFERVAMKENSPLIKLFNIKSNKKITGAVMVGYPKYTYQRLVDRNPLEFTFINQ
ncbi:nitroreductase family protein [Clostridium saccharoperbutylacetonicum]|uniref:nitroreductase family protein n=1 Tax=Clostridium saccharoperbutylacetonicum TaxID=36745 RepID=UPI0009839B6E|nr:nitroreductase family protein [Clostridium saccharoperbutylacetonicum]AQR97398.1 ferredoxin-2 [Clostridium saccharoperbutylacetonicum]NSB33282.1 nitroreductase/NAD-dependent dihydropyrimidine dehydrogenase PreA subunit [Clostridium saccharoperbutylacetonicum]